MGLNVANLLLKISGEPDDAKRALLEITGELKKFGEVDESAKVGLDGYDEAKAKLDSLDRSLTVLGQRNVTAKVKINVDDAKAKLAALRRELDLSASGGAGALPTRQVLGDIENLGNEVERATHSRFERIAQDSKSFFHRLFHDFGNTFKTALKDGIKGVGNAAAGGVGLLLEGAGAAGKGIISLGASAIGAIGPMGALLGVILLFAPALIALTASLAGAIAGFGVLAVAFVGTLAPAVLLLLGAVKELTQAWTAVTKQQEKAKASALAIAQANQGVHSSTLALGAAQHNLKEQTTSAYEAWRSQIRAVKEDLLGVRSAQLGVEQSQLSYKQALQSLQEFRSQIGLGGGQFDDLFKKFTNVDFDPSKILSAIKNAGGGSLGKKQDLELQQLILAIKEAKLGEAQAQNSLHSSNEKLEKDRRIENKYIKEGIKAYPAYVAALKEVRTAQEGLATAERGLARAQNSAASPLKGVSKEQLALGKDLHSFVNDLKTLLAPAINGIFKGLENGLHSVLGLLKDSGLSSAFKALGHTIGGVFETLGKTFASPEVRRGLTELVKGSSQLVKSLGSSVLVSFIRLFTKLAVAAMPTMLRFVEKVAGALKRLADRSSVDELRKKISHILREFEEWARLVGAFARLLKAFFHDASGQGDSLAKSIRKLFEGWTEFLETKAGQEEVTNFLRESIELAHDFIKVIKAVIEVVSKLAEILEPVIGGIESVSSSIGEKFFGQFQEEGIEKDKEAQKRQQQATIDSANKQLKSGRNSKGERLTPEVRRFLETQRARAERELHPLRRAMGGIVPGGYGGGDRVSLLTEPGEYILRKEVVASVGRASLDRLNSTGHLGNAHTGAEGRGDTFIDKIVLPAVPGSTGIDPRVAAVKLGKELSKRGLG